MADDRAAVHGMQGLQGRGWMRVVIAALGGGHVLGRRPDCPNSHCPDSQTLGVGVHSV